jgi:(2Fe-2S) ferredoxin
MADSMSADRFCSNRFCSIGQFLRFLPGEKSPYQKILWERLPDKDASDSAAEPLTQELWLGSDLRKMMYRYLEPHDWVRIVAKQAMDKRSAQLVWKATEISRLSCAQASQLTSSQLKSSQLKSGLTLGRRDHPPSFDLLASDSLASNPLASGLSKTAATTDKPLRVLICQKSSCRQRGSMAVVQAMEGAIAQSSCPQKIFIQATGCMKRCQAGPNVVMLPGGSYSQVTPADGRSLIQTRLSTTP